MWTHYVDTFYRTFHTRAASIYRYMFARQRRIFVDRVHVTYCDRKRVIARNRSHRSSFVVRRLRTRAVCVRRRRPQQPITTNENPRPTAIYEGCVFCVDVITQLMLRARTAARDVHASHPRAMFTLCGVPAHAHISWERSECSAASDDCGNENAALLRIVRPSRSVCICFRCA